jgi:hypothetical protein
MRSTGACGEHVWLLSARIGLPLAGIAVASILLAACGASNTSSTTTTTAPRATTTTTGTATSAPTVNPATSSEIIANWTTFFSGRTSAAKKLALLQNGSTFASIVNGQASSGLAQSAKAKVSTVTDLTATAADVHYSIYLGSTPALPNEVGVAVKQDGIWKVSDASFCVLLNLEGVRSAACPAKHAGS